MRCPFRVSSLVLVALLQAIPAAAEGVDVVRAFPANRGPGWKASIDVAGAVGQRHVVDFDVAGFVVQDKETGAVQRRLTTREFWHQVEPAGTLLPVQNANDARMLYDPLSHRWFACAAGTTEPDCFLAVSTTPDPLEPWRGGKLPLPQINPYMRMGVDRHGLYVCSCNGHVDFAKGTNCYVLPKQDALAVGGPVLTRGHMFKEVQFSCMPAMDPDPEKPADAPAVLLANEFSDGTCGRLFLYRIVWSGTTASISGPQVVPLGTTYLTPDNKTPLMEAVQPPPGPSFRVGGGGRRIDSAFVRNGRVYGCNGAKRTAGSRPGVLWYEIRIRDGALLQEGFVDSPDRDLIHPSIAVDARGNIGIGCTGTSRTEYPSVYVMMHGAMDPPGSMRTPVPALPGTTSYRYPDVPAINLSHYSATCIDPSNPDRLWTLQAYSASEVEKQWCTGWAVFRIAD